MKLPSLSAPAPTKTVRRGLPLRPPVNPSQDPDVNDCVPVARIVNNLRRLSRNGNGLVKKSNGFVVANGHAGMDAKTDPWPPAGRAAIHALAYRPAPAEFILSKKNEEMFFQLALKMNEMKESLSELRELLSANLIQAGLNTSKYGEQFLNFLERIQEKEDMLKNMEIVMNRLRREAPIRIGQESDPGLKHRLEDIHKMALKSLTLCL